MFYGRQGECISIFKFCKQIIICHKNLRGNLKKLTFLILRISFSSYLLRHYQYEKHLFLKLIIRKLKSPQTRSTRNTLRDRLLAVNINRVCTQLHSYSWKLIKQACTHFALNHIAPCKANVIMYLIFAQVSCQLLQSSRESN